MGRRSVLVSVAVKRTVAALVAVALVASTSIARAETMQRPAAPAEASEPVPVIEPLPTKALPAAPPRPQPPPALPPAQPQMIHQRYAVPAVAGRVVFGISYGFAFIVGVINALTPSLPANSISSDVACDSTCKEEGALLLVPVAGPLLSTELSPQNATGTKVALIWSGVEAAGLAMIIVGLIGHDVPQAQLPTEAPALGRVSVVPLVTPEGGTLSMRMAF
jgi:hypothetical protein